MEGVALVRNNSRARLKPIAEYGSTGALACLAARAAQDLAQDLTENVGTARHWLRLARARLPGIRSQILAECVDLERLARAPIELFVTATSVRTGRGRVFRNGELTPDVLLASGCLPTLFQAIEIDGEAYWDGGFAGNPTITPLVRECASQWRAVEPAGALAAQVP